jgi:flagellin-like protein
MREPEFSGRRKAISGIIAALILFVMLFTVGTGYFLWTNTTNSIYSAAQANRGQAVEQQQLENLVLIPSICLSGLCTSNDLNFVAQNTGGSTVILETAFVDSAGGTCTNPIGLTLNAGTSSMTKDTGCSYTPGTAVTLKVLTQRGNVFTAHYPSASAIATFLSASAVPVGQPVNDSAVLSQVTSNAGGTIAFYYSATASCPIKGATHVGILNVTVVNGVVTGRSAQKEFPSAGVFYWYAIYSGDLSNNPATSVCEPLVVTPSLTTSLSPKVVSAGGKVSDTATLLGLAGSSPTGTVTFYYSTSDSCPASSGATQVGTPIPVSGSKSQYISASIPLNSPGFYFWYAVYSGGGPANPAATSSCEPIFVEPTSPPVTCEFSSYCEFQFVPNSLVFFDSQTNPAGDGFLVNGYLPYCCIGNSYQVGTPLSEEGGGGGAFVSQLQLVNQDPNQRTITISANSFISYCGQNNWIVSTALKDSSNDQQVSVLPYSTLPGIPSGGTVTLSFGASSQGGGGPPAEVPTNQQCPLTVTISGTYPDSSTFVEIFSLNFATVTTPLICPGTMSDNGNCEFSSNLRGSAGSTLTAAICVQGSPNDPCFSAPPRAYWLNTLDGTLTDVTVRSDDSSITFQIPPTASLGADQMEVTDGTNFAYGTVHVVPPTTTAVSCIPASVGIGVSSTCTASVSGYSGSVAGEMVTFTQSGTGSVTFQSENTCSLSAANPATCSVAVRGSTIGSVTITATYPGDDNNVGGSGSTTLTVGKSSTATTVTCVPAIVGSGSSTTCTAMVTGYGTPTGTVIFTSSGAGTFSPSNGQCTLSGGSCHVSFIPSNTGTQTITATYGGDNNNAGSSGTFSLTVLYSTITTVMCNPGSVRTGTVTTCTATVTSSNGTPTGTVTFLASGSGSFNPSNGQCTLSAGSCHVNYTPSTSGTQTITANYGGDATHAPSSGTFSLVVTKPSLSLDCSASGGSTSNSGGVITSAMSCNSGDLIIVFVTEDSTHTVSSISDSQGVLPASIWTERTGLPYNPNSELIDEWYAIAPSALSSDTITVHFSGNSNHHYVAVAFGIAGANTANPFDSNFGSPRQNSGSSGTPSVGGITTSYANDMIIGLEGHLSGLTGETAGSGFTLIATQKDSSGNNQWGSAEYEVVSSMQSGITVRFGSSVGSNNWAMLVDAVQDPPAASGNPVQKSSPPSSGQQEVPQASVLGIAELFLIPALPRNQSFASTTHLSKPRRLRRGDAP